MTNTTEKQKLGNVGANSVGAGIIRAGILRAGIVGANSGGGQCALTVVHQQPRNSTHLLYTGGRLANLGGGSVVEQSPTEVTWKEGTVVDTHYHL